MNNILKKFENYEIVKNIDNNLDSTSNSSIEEAVSIASLYNKNKGQIIIVKDNLYHAEQLYEKLSHMLDDVNIFMSEESNQ